MSESDCKRVKVSHNRDDTKSPSKTDDESKSQDALYSRLEKLRHGGNRPIPKNLWHKFTEREVDLLEQVDTSCHDLEKLQECIRLRMKYRLVGRIPENYDSNTYYIKNGLRHVYPYSYFYQAYVKKRWIGRKLREVITTEFRDIPSTKLEERFNLGMIWVNGRKADVEHTIADNDFVCNFVHRHELPVLAAPIKIIYQDSDIVVVDKPPSIPVHPCGRFRLNSLTQILERDYFHKKVHTVHRLDRLVSGVMLAGFNQNKAGKIQSEIQDRSVEKRYVCRVRGEFPLGPEDDDGEILVDEPLEHIPGKIGITVVIPEGKPSQTSFKRLNYNGKTSAVLCKPKTGRMHQIRVHLQYLGFPIINDLLYDCDSFGPEKGKGARYGKTLASLMKDVVDKHRASTWLLCDVDDGAEIGETASEKDDKTKSFLNDEEREETMAAIGHYLVGDEWDELKRKYAHDASKETTDPICMDCARSFHNPPFRRLFMYLHALRYSGSGWSYETEMPAWAKADWKY